MPQRKTEGVFGKPKGSRNAGGVLDGSRWLSAQRDTTGYDRARKAPRQGCVNVVMYPCRGAFSFDECSGGVALRAQPPATLYHASGVRIRPPT
jgi:hypothetical protein